MTPEQQAIAAELLPLARKAVRTLVGRKAEIEHHSAAQLALCEAVMRHKPSPTVSLKTSVWWAVRRRLWSVRRTRIRRRELTGEDHDFSQVKARPSSPNDFAFLPDEQQQQIAAMLVDGFTGKEIAAKLGHTAERTYAQIKSIGKAVLAFRNSRKEKR